MERGLLKLKAVGFLEAGITIGSHQKLRVKTRPQSMISAQLREHRNSYQQAKP
jgi:hypothetical protein